MQRVGLIKIRGLSFLCKTHFFLSFKIDLVGSYQCFFELFLNQFPLHKAFIVITLECFKLHHTILGVSQQRSLSVSSLIKFVFVND